MVEVEVLLTFPGWLRGVNDMLVLGVVYVVVREEENTRNRECVKQVNEGELPVKSSHCPPFSTESEGSSHCALPWLHSYGCD